MKPLREHLDDPDLAVRAGAALLSKVQPFELSMTQRRRIRARIDAVAEQPAPALWEQQRAAPGRAAALARTSAAA